MHAHPPYGYPAELAHAYRVHDPMTVRPALDQQRPIHLLEQGRVADEESHRHIEKPALEIPVPDEHRGMTRMHWLEPHRHPPGGAGSKVRAGLDGQGTRAKCAGGGDR